VSRYTAEQRAAAVRRYVAGESSTAIAADVGCVYQTVLRWVREAGHDVRARFGRGAA